MNLQQIVNQILSVNPIVSIETIEANLTAKNKKFIRTDLLNDLSEMYDVRGTMVVSKVPTEITKTMTQMNKLINNLYMQDITVWANSVEDNELMEISGTVYKLGQNGYRYIGFEDTVKCYAPQNIRKLKVGVVTVVRK
jgi:hypothetical protein